MATTTNFDKMTRTTREVTEAQREAFEALTENLTAFQRRSADLTQDGMEFLRLQEQNAKAGQQLFSSAMKVAQLQQRSISFAQNWLREGAEAVQEQTERNLRTAEVFARSARKQQKGFQVLVQGWADAYESFVFSPFNLAQEGFGTAQRATEQGMKATQRVVEQGAEVSERVTSQGLRVAEEASERTEEVLRKTEEATREAELRASVLASLETDNYEGLTVAEVTEKLDGLSVEELRQLREFEKRNKGRESLVERIDRKIRAIS